MRIRHNMSIGCDKILATVLMGGMALAFWHLTPANAEVLQVRPTVIVAPQAVIRGEEIKLGAIANVSSADLEMVNLVARLKSVRVAASPAPKATVVLQGNDILNAIVEAGISPDSIGYSIPQTVSVEREGRVVSNNEVMTALQQLVEKDKGLEVQLKEVSWPNQQLIPMGETQVRVERLGEPSSGKIPLRVEVFVDDKPAARFLATAMADDWREVPVLGRRMERGEVIGLNDVQMVRLNMLKLPNDVAAKTDELIGRRAKMTIMAGETIKRSSIDIPPVIPKGQKVKMLLQSGMLIASATGVAVEDGFDGSIVRVRNDSSKKIVEAVVVSPEEVRVKMQ